MTDVPQGDEDDDYGEARWITNAVLKFQSKDRFNSVMVPFRLFKDFLFVFMNMRIND